MKFTVYIVYLLLLFSCQHNCSNELYNDKQKDVDVVQDNLTSKFDKQKQFLFGRMLPSVTTILDDTLSVEESIFFIYNEMDCADCIKKGFNIVNKLEALMLPNIFVIATIPNSGVHRLIYDYHKYVYIDEQDLVRKDLKYITTPILLVLDEHKQILQVLFPSVSSEKENEEFIEQLNTRTLRL